MTPRDRLYGLAFVAAAAALVAAFLIVEFRARHPEWKVFQAKGTALTIAKLERELAAEQVPAKRDSIRREIDSLSQRELQIIEIRPFGGKLAAERCLTCHFGIEDLSSSHPNAVFGCVICHGGNGPDLTVKGAHRGLRGGRNPSRLDLAAVSCGSQNPLLGTCHSQREHHLLNRVVNVPRSLMATNAGIVSILRFQWGMEKDTEPKYAVRDVSDGKTSLKAVPGEITPEGKFSLADSHFRKFCASCHLWTSRHEDIMGRFEGCAACHASYSHDGRYKGCDPTIDRSEVGHAATHTMTNQIPNERCRACHNRSARVGLNYQGEMESEQYGAPFVRGGLNDYTLTDGRFVLKLVPDIHHEKGMGCIDCHTGQDAMGDGVVYGHMEDQIEIRCEDCHGSHTTPPRSIRVTKQDPLVQALASSYRFIKLAEGDEILTTSRGRPMPHIKKTPKGYILTDKLTGKERPVTVITGKKDAHRIKGHELLACDSCHSAWSPQCYGCHQALDFGHQGLDHISKKMTPGRWAEGRSFFRFERNIYGIDSRGRAGILTPGCQVWNTVRDAQGKTIAPYDSRIMRLRNGMTSIALGPIHPHTTRTEAPRCVDCHLDAKALGFGEGRMQWTDASNLPKLEPIYDSRNSGLQIDYPLEAAVDSQGSPLQSTSHKLSRPFNREELKKIVGIAPCLPCHDRYDDPAWEKGPPYVETPACKAALKKAGQ